MSEDDPYYVMDGSKCSADGKTIVCPSCGKGVAPSFPEANCDQCGRTITFVVAEKGSIPSDLADWEAAQREFQELRHQVAGQEDFIEEHGERLDRLESAVDRLAQFEAAVVDELDVDLEGDDA